jgi:Flp pilus assembly protein TadB
MLEQSGMDDKRIGYAWASVILAALGLLVGIWLDNPLAAIVLAAGLAALPLIVIFFRTGEYTRALTEKLETTMSILTNTYIQTGDFIGAVESNIQLLPAPLDGIFRRYLTETRLIDSSQERALSNLRDQINNRHWRDWCSILIQCTHDRQLRFALPGIVERLGETRRIQMEVDTAFQKHFSDYILTVIIVLGSIPLMGMMMPQWYDALMHTLPGKIMLAVVLAAALATGIWVSRINRPIEK